MGRIGLGSKGKSAQILMDEALPPLGVLATSLGRLLTSVRL